MRPAPLGSSLLPPSIVLCCCQAWAPCAMSSLSRMAVAQAMDCKLVCTHVDGKIVQTRNDFTLIYPSRANLVKQPEKATPCFASVTYITADQEKSKEHVPTAVGERLTAGGVTALSLNTTCPYSTGYALAFFPRCLHLTPHYKGSLRMGCRLQMYCT